VRSWTLVLALASCGDDGLDPNSCEPAGFTDGTSESGDLGPFERAEVIRVGELYALAFDEVAGTCGETASTGTHVVMLMCDPPEVRNYRVVAKAQFRCPGAEVLAIVEQDGPTDVAQSSSGILSIESAGSCVRGTYSVQLTADVFEGAFDAVVCD
jgi:hypothetical protein